MPYVYESYEKKVSSKILIIGYGSVSQCTLPLLMEKIDVPLENITIIDFEDKSKALKKYTDQGLRYVCKKITRENLDQVLSQYLENEGLLIDLSWNTTTNDIIKWCYDQKVLYVNTSVEVWDPAEGFLTQSLLEKSLYSRQVRLFELSRGLERCANCCYRPWRKSWLDISFRKASLAGYYRSYMC
ncbi:saccharopine dehydrogenase NADP-binding domain-containing protein [Methanosarcina sp. UBA411]|jgi:homospermidine synthase|uniref:saccharopine dehydrogenase NADP-binding domain-containing protein n=1 Tax=Methanosarcina sp. UBA411 TaxID=1915589 RepID=UPI0025F35B38|nr:saccharopine dehydrogenase NADP-binding domain-containing protein [Methanosarcina sp. UBA411]